MAWIELIFAVPAVFLGFALVHDFFAGLSDEKLWSDPAIDERVR